MTNSSRLKTLASRYRERQDVARTGSEYQPAIKAVRGEAPSISRCCRIWWPANQRHIHTLSSTETTAVIVALFYPGLVDLLEQRCLPPQPAPHPLSSYPEMRGARLPELEGTVAVARRLGCIKSHPRFLMDDGEASYPVPLPLVGDLLLILRDKVGLYAKNWTVKSDESGFNERLNRRPLRRRSLDNIHQAKMRYQIEEKLYSDVDIPTHRIIATTFDKNFVANLRHCLGWMGVPSALASGAKAGVLASFRSIVGTYRAPIDLIVDLRQRFRCSRDDLLVEFYQAIWRGELRVDLFRPVLFDTPLRPEILDPFSRYGGLFSRSAK
jgi:hypothetical protein